MLTCSAKRLCIMLVTGNLIIWNPVAWRCSNPLTIDIQNKMEEAHRAAFNSIQKVIDRDIVLGENIVQLSYLTKIYTESLLKTDFTNNNYYPENLKANIKNCSYYKDSISFAKPRVFESILVCNNKVLAKKLIHESFQLGTDKQLKNVGQIFKTQVKSHFEETQRTPIRPIIFESLGQVDL